MTDPLRRVLLDLHQAIETMRGQPDRLIADATGEPLWKVREWRRAAGIRGHLGRRERWDRRQALLNDAAGLDFQTAFASHSLCAPFLTDLD